MEFVMNLSNEFTMNKNIIDNLVIMLEKDKCKVTIQYEKI